MAQLLSRDSGLRSPSAEALQATVNLVGAGVSHLSLDQQILWANPSYCALLGYTLDELQHLNIRQTTHPDDRELQARLIGRLLTGELDLATWEKRFVRKDGSEVWGRINASLLRDAEGAPRHFVAVTADITSLKAAELDLRLQRRQLEDAESVAQFGSWERELATGALRWSAGGYALFGLDPTHTQLTFELFLSMVHPDDRQRLVSTLQQAFASANDFEVEYRITRADGEPRTLHVRGRLFKDDQGRPLRTLGTMQDVTERRRSEQTIAAQQQALVHAEALAAIGALSASVAHEINNPLAYVLLNLEALLAHPGDAASQHQHLHEALDGVRRVSAMVKTLKGLSGLHPDEPSPVDVTASLEAALAMAANAVAHRATIVKDFEAVPLVLGDDVRLSQVFLNLLVNAAAAIDEGNPAGNEIRLVVRAAQDEVMVEVRDSGCGIPHGNLGRIFEPFFSTKSRARGTGLGLPISKKIVEETGGRIEVRSEPGRGSSFVVWLRVAPADAVAKGPPAPVPAPVATAAVARVLVIDDERLIRRAIARALPACAIVEAASGDQACELLGRDRAFDVVLCDMMMPGMSGMDLHAWLSGVDPALAARMVFITGGAFTTSAREFLDRADIHRLEKPFDGATLRGLVEAIGAPRRTG
jgi:PAS domain S-box-containing protein